MLIQENAILKALVNKIKKENNIAFYSKNVLSTNLLSWNTIENLLNDFYRFTQYEIELISPQKTKIPYPLIDADWIKYPRPDPSFIFEKINLGYSLVILGASRLSYDINNICSIIESSLPNMMTDVHVYCGLSKSKSFKAHFDYADNLILHQSGKCRWKIYKQCAQDHNFEENVDGSTLDVEFETDIESGDLIYVPKYQYHECFPLKKRISLSIPMCEGEKPINRNWYRINEK